MPYAPRGIQSSKRSEGIASTMAMNLADLEKEGARHSKKRGSPEEQRLWQEGVGGVPLCTPESEV